MACRPTLRQASRKRCEPATTISLHHRQQGTAPPHGVSIQSTGPLTRSAFLPTLERTTRFELATLTRRWTPSSNSAATSSSRPLIAEPSSVRPSLNRRPHEFATRNSAARQCSGPGTLAACSPLLSHVFPASPGQTTTRQEVRPHASKPGAESLQAKQDARQSQPTDCQPTTTPTAEVEWQSLLRSIADATWSDRQRPAKPSSQAHHQPAATDQPAS